MRLIERIDQRIRQMFLSSSRAAEQHRYFEMLWRIAPVKLGFELRFEGADDSLQPLANCPSLAERVRVGMFAATSDTKDRKILVIAVAQGGHLVIRAPESPIGFFHNWASPAAKSMQDMARRKVDIPFVLDAMVLGRMAARLYQQS